MSLEKIRDMNDAIKSRLEAALDEAGYITTYVDELMEEDDNRNLGQIIDDAIGNDMLQIQLDGWSVGIERSGFSFDECYIHLDTEDVRDRLLSEANFIVKDDMEFEYEGRLVSDGYSNDVILEIENSDIVERMFTDGVFIIKDKDGNEALVDSIDCSREGTSIVLSGESSTSTESFIESFLKENGIEGGVEQFKKDFETFKQFKKFIEMFAGV